LCFKILLRRPPDEHANRIKDLTGRLKILHKGKKSTGIASSRRRWAKHIISTHKPKPRIMKVQRTVVFVAENDCLLVLGHFRPSGGGVQASIQPISPINRVRKPSSHLPPSHFPV